MKPEDFKFRKQYKKAVVKLIKKHRKDGATYEEISDLFNNLNYETLSGNGLWYAQSIHRLCQ